MRIGFDLRPLKTGSRNRGIGNYISSLIRAMLAMDSVNEYFLYFEKSSEQPDFSESERVCLRPLRLSGQATYAGVSAIMNESIDRDRIDVMVNTSPFEMDVKMPRRYKCHSVVIVYDIIPLLFFNHYLLKFPEELRKEYFCNLRSLANYDRIVTISRCTKDDIVKFLGISPEKIQVIFAGVSPQFRPLPGFSGDEIKRKYNIRNDFFICTGGSDHRKNLHRLIESFGLVCRENSGVDLAIVCKLHEGQARQLMAVANAAGVPDRRLILTNFVPEEDMIMLYNASIGLIFPSLYEGFGLPVLEGMACGKAVITSGRSSLPEVCKDTGLLVDPCDVGEISRAMLRLAGDKKLREHLGRSALEISRGMGWDNVAASMLRSLETVCSSGMPLPINQKR